MTLATEIDVYQITMLRGYFENNMHKNKGAMEVFARKLPDTRNYFVVAGIARIIDYLYNLKFTDEDIKVFKRLSSLQIQDDNNSFFNYLKSVDFSKELKLTTMPEGSVAFPHEPFLRIEGPIGLCQFVEKKILSIINADVKIASKASRIITAAKGRPVFEFGGRRAHDGCTADAARAAYIAGFAGTSNVEAFARYGIPASGTMGHVWIMSHETEEQAFINWSKIYHDSVYLTDTYNTHNGIDKAIKIAGGNMKGIRLDSGNLRDLSNDAKRVLNKSGSVFEGKVFATNDLDEYTISQLICEGASIDIFGVGTQLVATPDSPSLGFVYKLVSTSYEENGEEFPICKVAADGKGTWPGKKQVWRNFVEYKGKRVFTNDTISIADEDAPSALSVAMLEPVEIQPVDHEKEVLKARGVHFAAMENIPPYLKMITNHKQMDYPVDFSDKLSILRQDVRNSKRK